MVQQWRTYFVLTTAYLLLMITWNKKRGQNCEEYGIFGEV